MHELVARIPNCRGPGRTLREQEKKILKKGVRGRFFSLGGKRGRGNIYLTRASPRVPKEVRRDRNDRLLNRDDKQTEGQV